MAEYSLRIKNSAAKELEAAGSRVGRRRIVESIGALAVSPRGQGTEKLAGHGDRYRVRQGSYRIIYLVNDGRREITIFKIGHRKEVYR